MPKIKMGYDYESKRRDDINRPKKASYLLELESFFNDYDLTFKEDAESYVQSFRGQFEIRYSDSFPVFVNIDKMLELSEVSFDVLIALERFYKEIPPIDNERDYNIYTLNERQDQAFKIATDCLVLIERIGDLYSPINNKQFNDLSISLRGLITIDKNTSKRAVNCQRIQSL
jgi:hypothetical protein